MKEMYAQLGISSEVYDFGHKIEESLKERFEKFDKTAEYNQILPVMDMTILAGKHLKRFMQILSIRKPVWYARRSHAELTRWPLPYSVISVRVMNFWHLPESLTILWKS